MWNRDRERKNSDLNEDCENERGEEEEKDTKQHTKSRKDLHIYAAQGKKFWNDAKIKQQQQQQYLYVWYLKFERFVFQIRGKKTQIRNI